MNTDKLLYIKKLYRMVVKFAVGMLLLLGLITAYFMVFNPSQIGKLTQPLLAFANKKNYRLPETKTDPGLVGTDTQFLKSFGKVFSNIAKQTRPALVYIMSKRVVETRRGNSLEEFFFGFPFGPGGGGMGPEKGIQQGAGSGFIVDLDNGYVITNNHVIQDATELTVTTFDNRQYKAKPVGTHKDTDVAVIKIEKLNPSRLKQVSFADSDSVEVGDWVLALGAPFELPQTMTMGIVSALGRGDVIKESASMLQNFIQTDAAINPGNSGGPLLNIEGKVIGINTAIYSRTGSYAGIGFSVPSNMARTVAESLINEGKVVRGFLGIEMSDDLSSIDLLPEGTEGTLIRRVSPNSPADKAGLKVYDVIQSVDSRPVRSGAELARIIGFTKPNAEVKLGVLRDGKTITVRVKIAQAPDRPQGGNELEGGNAAPSALAQEFGFALGDLNDQYRNKLKTKVPYGVVVLNVQDGSLADRLGFNGGDIIIEINRRSIKKVADVEKFLKQANDKRQSLVFLVERDGERQLIVLRAQ